MRSSEPPVLTYVPPSARGQRGRAPIATELLPKRRSGTGMFAVYSLTEVENPMIRNDLLSRIAIDPKVCFGKPCIRGHRVWVSLILDLLAAGMSAEQLLREYPQLEEADLLACIAYGAEMARERYVDLPTGTGS